VGEFKNGGREWRPKGEPLTVKTHDFMDPELGKAIPYGVYDLSRNEGWVSVQECADTAGQVLVRQWPRTLHSSAPRSDRWRSDTSSRPLENRRRRATAISMSNGMPSSRSQMASMCSTL
jgi:hypothetical protein